MENKPKSIKLTAEQWAEIVIKNWEDRIEKLNIGYSEQLVDSLVHELKMAGPDVVSEVIFKFNYYGKFVDMGVGKGIKLSQIVEHRAERQSVGGKRYRKPKKWYSKVFFSEVQKLSVILAEHFAREAAFVIRENLDDNALRHKAHKL